MTAYELIYAEDANCVGGVGVIEARRVDMRHVRVAPSGRMFLTVGDAPIEMKLPKFLILEGGIGVPAQVKS